VGGDWYMGLCGAGLNPRVSQHDPFPHPSLRPCPHIAF
jgi:hypothetical protein